MAIAAYTVWSITTGTQVSAVVTEEDDGWCTYVWEGPPEPDDGLNGDACPPGVGLGDRVEILAFPDGSAWTSTSTVWYTLGPILAVGAIAATGFIAIALWLLLAGRR